MSYQENKLYQQMSEEDQSNIEQYLEENANTLESLIEAALDNGYKTAEDIIDFIETGDYSCVFAGPSDSDLGYAVTDEMGYPDPNNSYYFDEKAYEKDLRMEYYEEQEDDESDEDYRERIEQAIQSIMNEVFDNPNERLDKDTLERYFDYDQFGYDLRLEGYSWYSTDSVWIQTF